MHASETVSPMATHAMQTSVAGTSVGYAFISENQRARVIADRTGFDYTAVQVYGTVAMNDLHLGAYERAGKGASSRSCHIERDNQVFTDLARGTSIIEPGKKTSVCREWRSASFSARKCQWHADNCERTKNCAQM